VYAADRPKYASEMQMVGWLGHAGKAAENNLAHPTANGTPLVHNDCPPRTI
jgi:hypothetical protein